MRNESSENGEIEEKEWKHRARKHVKRTGLGSAKPLVPSPHSSVRLQCLTGQRKGENYSRVKETALEDAQRGARPKNAGSLRSRKRQGKP